MNDEYEPPVGSPAWLELQHQKERQKERRSAGGATRVLGSGGEIVVGLVFLAMAVAFNILLTPEPGRSSLFVLTGYGFLVFRVFPGWIGIGLVFDGIRRRRQGY